MKMRLSLTAILLLCGLPAAASASPVGSSCPLFKWTTLGTASGPVPTPERSEPANLLQAGDQKILVDAGDGAATQLAKLGLTVGDVGVVFISHHHMDHTGGLAAVIGIRWMNQFPGPLVIYGPPGTKQLVEGIVESMAPQARIGFGTGVYPPPPAGSVTVIEISAGQKIDAGGMVVTAVDNSHYSQSTNDKQRADSFSYRFDYGGRSITYTGDTGPSAAVDKLAGGSDLLISEIIEVEALIDDLKSTRPNVPPSLVDNIRTHFINHHLTAEKVGELASAAKVKHVVLTHLGIPAGPLRPYEGSMRRGIGQHFTGPVDFATDLASFSVGC